MVFVKKFHIDILFYIFSISHVLSYTTSILFNITLDYERAGVGFLLILLYYRYLDRSAIQFNILMVYLYIFTAFFSKFIFEHLTEAIGFLLYFNVIYIYWKHLKSKYNNNDSLFPKLYMFSALPLLLYMVPLLFNPHFITLDFYSNPQLEQFGLKSRTIGWSAACSLPLIFYWARNNNIQRYVSIIIGAIIIVLVIGSGSRSSIIGMCLFMLISIMRTHLKYKIYWSFLLIIFSIVLVSKSDELSLTRRAKLHEMGVSDDSFRQNLVSGFLNHLINDFPKSLLPGGAGYENMQVSLNQFFVTNGFGTHNTYISIYLAFGILSVIIFKNLFTGLKSLYNQQQLLFCIPFLVISLTEDCFGPGQLLFPLFITIIVAGRK